MACKGLEEEHVQIDRLNQELLKLMVEPVNPGMALLNQVIASSQHMPCSPVSLLE